MSAKWMARLERLIARKALADAKLAGFTFNVENGGDGYELPAPTGNVKLVLDTMFAAGEDVVSFFRGDDPRPRGWVLFIGGNGCDVISDHSVGLAETLKGATALADRYAD